MKKILLMSVTLPLLLAACTKHKETPFEAKGKWEGTIFIYETALFNQAENRCLLYIRVPNGDTATAPEKYTGTYISTENSYRATFPRGGDSLIILANKTDQQFMAGYARPVNAPGNLFPFQLFRK